MTSDLSPYRTRLSSRYLAQAFASRTSAPRGVRRLCILGVAFSAMQSARSCGKYRFISAGASVPGVCWNSTSMPSIRCVSIAFSITTEGGIRPIVPPAVTLLLRPVSTWPRTPRGNSGAA